MKCPHLLWTSAAQLLPARMRSLRVCKKWMMCMYVPVCAKRLCVSVKPSARRGRGGGGKGFRGVGVGGGGATVRPSLSLVCPSSSAIPFRHVPVAFALFPPPFRHHLLMLLRRVCQSSTGIKPPETPSSLPLSTDRLVVTQT